MKKTNYLIFILIFGYVVNINLTVAQIPKQLKRDLRWGRYNEDTSYVYELPFEKGKKVWLIQGYYGWFSHKHEKALDFKLRRGENICAVRSGRVIDTENNSKVSGFRRAYINQGNYVIVEHSDGSSAAYWHLKYRSVTVRVGQKVTTGTIIGQCGKSGFAINPHLHFWIFRRGDFGVYEEVATRFKTKKGIKYLHGGRWYGH